MVAQRTSATHGSSVGGSDFKFGNAHRPSFVSIAQVSLVSQTGVARPNDDKSASKKTFLSTKCSRNNLSQFFKQKIQYSGLLLQAQIIIYMHRLSPMKLIANGDSADKNSAKEFDVCSVDHC